MVATFGNIPTDDISRVLIGQYNDAQEQKDKRYLRNMRQALCEWVGARSWPEARKKLGIRRNRKKAPG